MAITLGAIVVLVAIYVTLDRGQLALNPLLLGAAAIISGLLSLKKGLG